MSTHGTYPYFIALNSATWSPSLIEMDVYKYVFFFCHFCYLNVNRVDAFTTFMQMCIALLDKIRSANKFFFSNCNLCDGAFLMSIGDISKCHFDFHYHKLSRYIFCSKWMYICLQHNMWAKYLYWKFDVDEIN